MLTLTQDAADVIKDLASTPGAEGLRIAPAAETPNTQGTGLQMELVAGPQPDDAVVVVSQGARLFLAPEAARALDDRVLDADVDGEQVRFAVLEQPDGNTG